MTIKDTQYQLIKDKIMKRELQKGSFPSISVIEKQIEEEFAGKITGTPRFNHRPIAKGQTSSSSDYNNMMDEILDDLTIGFAEVRNLNNQIMSLSSYYNSTRTRVEKDLRKIELKTEILATRSQSHVNRDVVGDNINDFSQVEFKADNKRNIPKTNALIDLRHSEVTLDKIKNATIKHDLSNVVTTVKSLTPDTEILHVSPIKHALQDHYEDAWRSVVTSKANNGGAVIQADFDFEKLVHATTVDVDIQSGKPMTVTLFTSSDGEVYTEYETRKVHAQHQWVFERQQIQYVRLLCKKNEEDMINGTNYEYWFGAKSISVKDDQYVTENYFVSKPFDIHNHSAIDYLHLNVEDYRPPGTHIRYYVGLDYDTNLIEWQEIQPDRPIEMKMVQNRNIEIDSYTDGYNDLLYNNFGQSFYSIIELPHEPLPKSIQLQMGRNMWSKETIQAPFTDESESGVYQTSIKDWIRTSSPKKMYMNIDNYQDILDKDTFQRYTTYVYIEDIDNIVNNEGSINVGDHASYALYVNNNKVKSINDRYILNLKTGWNKIEVLTYSRDYNQEIVFDLYLRELSDQVYANHQPLEEVSLYDLLNNTSNRIYNRFAVDEQNRLIVNYNPRELDILRNGVEYSLTYRYSVSDHQEHKIRLMAVLSKESPDISLPPRLKSYQIVIE